MKTTLRNIIARLLLQTGVTNPERCSRGRFSIATFHRVLPEADRKSYPYPGLAVTPEELDDILTYFKDHFDCGPLATQHERYLRGDLTERPLLALTFDDAQYDNYCHARPVLARHQLAASFFVPVVAVESQELLWHDRLGFAIQNLLKQTPGGRERLMQLLATSGLVVSDRGILTSSIVEASKGLKLEARLELVATLVAASGALTPPEFARLMTFDEIGELAADGHEIGSHSMTHCLMPECDDHQLAYEVFDSRRTLQNRTGQPIDTFCYPNGNSDARTALAVKKAGYRRAVTTRWGSNDSKGDPLSLLRYDMTSKRVQNSRGKFEPALLAFRMSGFYPGLG